MNWTDKCPCRIPVISLHECLQISEKWMFNRNLWFASSHDTLDSVESHIKLFVILTMKIEILVTIMCMYGQSKKHKIWMCNKTKYNKQNQKKNNWNNMKYKIKGLTVCTYSRRKYNNAKQNQSVHPYQLKLSLNCFITKHHVMFI